MKEPKDVVIIGAGARGNKVFADLIDRHDTGFRNAGVVEPNADRRADFVERYGVPAERAFASMDEFIQAPRFGDIVFICTPDPTHYTICKAVSEKGYNVLLEKPIATNLADCLALLDVEHTYANRIFVAHVLRYSPFFRTVREIIRGGELGGIRNIWLSENVGYWHFAHSYVRGNWRRREDSAPVILTKSCHDLDILNWLLERRVDSVVSFGELSYFREEHAPPESAERCVDCPLEDSCLYSATRFYLNDRDEWPFNVIGRGRDSVEARRRAVIEGQYGRCVWHNDNDVCDNQTVVLQLEDGIHASFDLMAHTAENTRKIRILFDTAELWGSLRTNELYVSRFTGAPGDPPVERIPLPAIKDHHGGGDLALLHALYEHLETGEHREIMSSLRSSLASHVLAFLADQSRIGGNVSLPVPEIFYAHQPWAGPVPERV